MMDIKIPFNLAGGVREYHSAVWPGLVLEWKKDHLLLEFPAETEAVSSAVYGGGMGRLKRAVNQYVSRDYECSNPVRDMENKLQEWGYPTDGCAGLMTAVPLEHAAVGEADTGSAGIFCCVTAAAGNAARAGVERPVLAAYRPGTINIMLGIDGMLTPAAMVNAVMTAAEAKAAALADLGITDPENGLIATGTTTDAIMLAVSGSRRYGAEHVYAGTATDLGGAVGQLVYSAVTGSLQSVMAVHPAQPVQPTQQAQPAQPTQQAQQAQPTQPVQPTQATQQEQPGKRSLSGQDEASETAGQTGQGDPVEQGQIRTGGQ